MVHSVEVKKVSKSYGKIQALDDVSFYVEEATLFALLGQNGAGKSTMIDLICTLTDCDKGKIIINGFVAKQDDMAIRQSIGVVFQDSMLDDILSVEENLISRCGCYGLFHKDAHKRIDELSEMVGIQNILHQKTSTLSGGQRRRVDIARALITNPKLLILDEPTCGLDPSSRDQIWKTIDYLRSSQNMTVFLTTHYLEEAKQAHHVCILKQGKIVAQGTPQSIRQTYAFDHLFLYSSTKAVLIKQLMLNHVPFKETFHHIDITIKDSMHALSILKRVERWIDSFEVIAGTMDDAFVELMEGGNGNGNMDAR